MYRGESVYFLTSLWHHIDVMFPLRMLLDSRHHISRIQSKGEKNRWKQCNYFFKCVSSDEQCDVLYSKLFIILQYIMTELQTSTVTTSEVYVNVQLILNQQDIKVCNVDASDFPMMLADACAQLSCCKFVILSLRWQRKNVLNRHHDWIFLGYSRY